MYYLTVYLEDNTYHGYCSKNIQTLITLINESQFKDEWTISNQPQEGEHENYADFEIVDDCGFSGKAN